jgi:RNA polymerase sigma-70 factor (ECF subfamily)
LSREVLDGRAEGNSDLDWRALYERYAEEVGRYLLKITGDPEAASDLMQDTFVRAMTREGQLRERTLIRAWLYRIATNLAMSHLRGRRLRTLFSVAPTWERQQDPASWTAEVDQVRRALRSIPPAQAICLVLRERGFTRREIAEICCKSEQAIKSRLARGEANFLAAYQRIERGFAR